MKNLIKYLFLTLSFVSFAGKEKQTNSFHVSDEARLKLKITTLLDILKQKGLDFKQTFKHVMEINDRSELEKTLQKTIETFWLHFLASGDNNYNIRRHIKEQFSAINEPMINSEHIRNSLIRFTPKS